MTTLILGASGLLGANAALRLSERTDVVAVSGTTRLRGPFRSAIADLRDPNTIDALLQKHSPSAVWNCVALANLERCENDPAEARLLNATLPGWIARACAQNQTPFIHFSTDAVFSRATPATEADEPNPVSEYGRTKVAGERAVQEANDAALIARVNFFAWSTHGHGLAEWVYGQLAAGRTLTGYADVTFNPLYVADVIDEVGALLNHTSGIVHVFGRETLTKLEFCQRLALEMGYPADAIVPGASPARSDSTAARSVSLTCATPRLQALGRPERGVSGGFELLRRDFDDGLRDRLRALREARA